MGEGENPNTLKNNTKKKFIANPYVYVTGIPS